MVIDPAAMFARRADSYARFIRLVFYRQGIRGYLVRSPHLRAGLRVLDAGCGTGAATLALTEALRTRGLRPGAIQGFDLTPAMLDRFASECRRRGMAGIETRQADVLHLDRLPASWSGYDLILSASMLEYVPRGSLAPALAGLRGLLAPGGGLVLFVTRRNLLTRPLIGRWWRGNLYDRSELSEAFRRAGFARFGFGSFPAAALHLSLWGHIVEAVC